MQFNTNKLSISLSKSNLTKTIIDQVDSPMRSLKIDYGLENDK